MKTGQLRLNLPCEGLEVVKVTSLFDRNLLVGFELEVIRETVVINFVSKPSPK